MMHGFVLTECCNLIHFNEHDYKSGYANAYKKSNVEMKVCVLNSVMFLQFMQWFLYVIVCT